VFLPQLINFIFTITSCELFLYPTPCNYLFPIKLNEIIKRRVKEGRWEDGKQQQASSQCQRLSANEELIVGDHSNGWVTVAKANGLYQTTEESRPCKMSQAGVREEAAVALCRTPGNNKLALGQANSPSCPVSSDVDPGFRSVANYRGILSSDYDNHTPIPTSTLMPKY